MPAQIAKSEDPPDEPEPDSLECDRCGAEIRHDEYCWAMYKAYNLHGDAVYAGKTDADSVLCRECGEEVTGDG